MRSQPHPGRQRWAEKWIHPGANLPMGKFEERTPAGATRSSLIWWRFIDDIFLLRAQGEVKLNEFINQIYPQGPHSHILMTGGGGGGSDRGSYFIPKKIPTSEFVYPKESLLFLAYPKKSLSIFASANFVIHLLEKLKHANFNFGFGQKQNYTKTNTKSSHDCYSVSSSGNYFSHRLQSQNIP